MDAQVDVLDAFARELEFDAGGGHGEESLNEPQFVELNHCSAEETDRIVSGLLNFLSLTNR